jgi:hypothetical protein
MVVLGAALLGAGCSSFQFNLAVDSTSMVVKKGSKALDRESDVDMAREGLPATVLQLATFYTAAPDNPVFAELTAQAYAQYTFGFLEDDLEKMGEADSPARTALVARCTDNYDRAYKIAVHMLEADDKDFASEIKTNPDKAIGELKRKEDAVGLYWAGFALGAAINLHRDDVGRVAELSHAIAMLERAHQLDPEYFNHGAALTLGVVYSSQGKAMGGNPEKAKALFEEVFKATDGKFLMAKVFYARFYATVTQDRPLFEKTLKEVLETPGDVMPDARLANELAKRRAARYLKQAEDLF